jgi:hypothetical protein
MKYIVDTSAILAGSKYDRYEKEYFGHYWENFDKRIQEGVIASTELVYREIIEKDDSMKDWAKKNKNMFKRPSQEILDVVATLHSKFPNWYKLNKSKKNWADSQVIAFAKYYDIVLVTQEGWNFDSTKERRFKIPTICSKCGALCHILDKKNDGIEDHNSFQCIDLLELIKRENLHEIK